MSLNKTCNKFPTIKYLSDVHPIKIGLKQEDVSAMFYFKCVLMYAIADVKANQKIEWDTSASVYRNDATLLGEKNIFSVKEMKGGFSWSLVKSVV